MWPTAICHAQAQIHRRRHPRPCPIHPQHGHRRASTANLSIVLVDARQGVIEQTRRHNYIAALLAFPLVIAINKMDLVDWSRERFMEIRDEIEAFLPKLDVFRDVKFIPLSALNGDNVVEPSPKTPWYEGPTLLGHLESVHIASDWNLNCFRFPCNGLTVPIIRPIRSCMISAD